MNLFLEAQPSPLEAWQGVAGRGRAWQEMGGFTVWSFLDVVEAEATQRHGNVARGGPSCKCYSFATCQNDQVQPCQCNFVGSRQILSDLVRSCQILSHAHWAGLFEQVEPFWTFRRLC